MIKIYSSKKKSLSLLMGSLLFVIMGFLLVTGTIGKNTFSQIIGLAAILFFGLGVYVSIRMLIKNKLILTIDSAGINVDPDKQDEKIPWANIKNFSTINIYSSKFIMINIDNPEYWINKERNKIRKKAMEFNKSEYGSPFCIAANIMDISYKKLIELLNISLEKYTK